MGRKDAPLLELAQSSKVSRVPHPPRRAKEIVFAIGWCCTLSWRAGGYVLYQMGLVQFNRHSKRCTGIALG